MSTEKEKMFQGEWYNANYDKELVDERDRARAFLFELNQTHPNKEKEINELFKKLIPQMSGLSSITLPFMCDYGYNIQIDDNSFINRNCYFMDGGKITIGKNVFIGPSCGFYTAIHPTNIKERNEGLEMAKPITIEDNVWLGGNVVIPPGVKIGTGSIIGAGSIVTKDVPANVIAVGNPCKVIKQIV